MEENRFVNKYPVKILHVLHVKETPLFKRQIRQITGATYSHISKTLSYLEENGYVEEKDYRPQNKRRIYVGLTSEGEELAEKFEDIVEEFNIHE